MYQFSGYIDVPQMESGLLLPVYTDTDHHGFYFQKLSEDHKYIDAFVKASSAINHHYKSLNTELLYCGMDTLQTRCPPMFVLKKANGKIIFGQPVKPNFRATLKDILKTPKESALHRVAKNILSWEY